MTFLKKLISDMPSKQLIFKTSRGKLLSQRVQDDHPLVIVRDPFIDKFNHAEHYKDT